MEMLMTASVKDKEMTIDDTQNCFDCKVAST